MSLVVDARIKRFTSTGWRNVPGKIGGFLLRYVVGVIFCQSALFAVAVVGWTYRLMRRNAVRYWYRASVSPDKVKTFAAFAAAAPGTLPLVDPPRWVLADSGQAPQGTGRVRRTAHRLTDSLWANLKTGFAGFATTCSLVLPAEVLWLFGWFAGWHISFNKVYEQHAVGLGVSWLGIGLFIVAMFYVPLAQARQAVTGDWRSFYDFRLVRTLIARHRIACLLLAGLYALCSLPVALFKLAPYFLGGGTRAVEAMTNAQLIALLNRYFFIATFLAFPLYVGLRLVAARIYARAIKDAVRDGVIPLTELSPYERLTLSRLGLADASPPPQPTPALVRVPRKALRAALVAATVATWFTFVAQIYVSEFFVYHGARGWLNQPLVQLPWYRYVPGHLDDSLPNSTRQAIATSLRDSK